MKKDNPKVRMKDARKEHKANSKSSDKKHYFNCGSSDHDVKNCTDADKGPKCFKCNCFGHIASKCNAKTNPSLETTPATVSCVNSVDDKFIVVDIEGRKLRALLDTGSEVSLIRDDVYSSLGEPKLSKTTRVFTGLGNAITKPSGTFLLKLHIDDNSYDIKAFVVPANSMTSELILGRDFLQNIEVVIKRGQIEVRRLPVEEYATEATKPDAAEKENSEKGFDVLPVMSPATSNEIEAPPGYKDKIETMIAEYKPKQNVRTSVETKIVLKDDVPVSHSPRRLAPKKMKILDEQIREWLRLGIITPSNSEYASPVVIVRKKDGSSRICIDYRALNKKIIRDKNIRCL